MKDKSERTYPPRPKVTNDITIHKVCGCGDIMITITIKEDDPTYTPYEVFARLGTVNSCGFCMMEGVTRAITMGLRHGVPAKVYALQLEGIKCPSVVFDDGEEILSCLDAIGRSLREYMQHVDDDTLDEFMGIIKDTKKTKTKE